MAVPGAAHRATGLHRFACLVAASTLFLIFAGGMVTSTGSGLAVPDWPLSFGQVFPEMKGGVFYEHGHRLIASAVGLLTVVLTTWIIVAEARNRVRVLALMAALAVILQGILGGVTVLYQLPPAVSIVHACLAQAFLCMAVSLAVVTGPGWLSRPDDDLGLLPRRLAVATTALIYGQLVLGAVMRHTGAGLAIPDFPTALGQWWPPLDEVLVRIHFLHRLGALAVFSLVAVTLSRVLGSREVDAWQRAPAGLLAVLLPVQITLGAFTVWTRKSPWITSAHVVVGAACLATSLVLALRLRRAPRAASPAGAASSVTRRAVGAEV